MIKFVPCSTYSVCLEEWKALITSLVNSIWPLSDSYACPLVALRFHGKPKRSDGSKVGGTAAWWCCPLGQGWLSHGNQLAPLNDDCNINFDRSLVEADDEFEHCAGQSLAPAAVPAPAPFTSHSITSQLASWRWTWEGVTKPLILFFLIWAHGTFSSYSYPM